MVKSIRVTIGLVLLAAAASAHAQSAGSCPTLPADTGLTWETKTAGATQVCRALRQDGSEAFGLYSAAESPFKPSRSDRAEAAQIDGRPSYWYRSEIAGRPDVVARETLIELSNGRVAYLWIQATSQDELNRALGQTNALRFEPQVSSK